MCIAEGFGDVGVRYVGGRWVMLHFVSAASRQAFRSCQSLMNLTKEVKLISKDFVVDERLIWVELKGLPLAAWSDSVVEKVISKWGELMFVEDGNVYPLASRRVCIAYANRNKLSEELLINVGGKRYNEVDMEVDAFQQEEGDFNGSEAGCHGFEDQHVNEDGENDDFEEGEFGGSGSGGCGFTQRHHHKSWVFESKMGHDKDVAAQGKKQNSGPINNLDANPVQQEVPNGSLPNSIDGGDLGNGVRSGDSRKTVSWDGHLLNSKGVNVGNIGEAELDKLIEIGMLLGIQMSNKELLKNRLTSMGVLNGSK
ncbi:hypothetical protein LXL04_018212 [Taraxacum kok-saghyz]